MTDNVEDKQPDKKLVPANDPVIALTARVKKLEDAQPKPRKDGYK